MWNRFDLTCELLVTYIVSHTYFAHLGILSMFAARAGASKVCCCAFVQDDS